MPPAGGETGNQSGEAYGQLSNWAQRDGTGVTFDSSTTFGFRTAKGERKNFLPFAPAFTIQVKSESDRLKQQHESAWNI